MPQQHQARVLLLTAAAALAACMVLALLVAEARDGGPVVVERPSAKASARAPELGGAPLARLARVGDRREVVFRP